MKIRCGVVILSRFEYKFNEYVTIVVLDISQRWPICFQNRRATASNHRTNLAST